MKINDSEFKRAIHLRAARAAVGASTVRGQGVPGLVRGAREYLGNLELRRFGVSGPRLFRSRLDDETLRFQNALPGMRWGAARKLLNIFLRDALYTVYVRQAYRLGSAEMHMELPLDSITAKKLRATAGRGGLCRWPGVRHLDQETSDMYQQEARRVAEQLGICRVHLDAFWWGDREDGARTSSRVSAAAAPGRHGGPQP